MCFIQYFILFQQILMICHQQLLGIKKLKFMMRYQMKQLANQWCFSSFISIFQKSKIFIKLDKIEIWIHLSVSQVHGKLSISLILHEWIDLIFGFKNIDSELFMKSHPMRWDLCLSKDLELDHQIPN